MKRVLYILILVSLIPSLLALAPRLRVEHPGPVVLTVDWTALVRAAEQRGEDPLTLLEHYRSLGVDGVAIYQPTVTEAADAGQLTYLSGDLLNFLYPAEGFSPGWFYLTAPKGELTPLEQLWTLPQARVVFRGHLWLGFPTDVSSLPAPPDTQLILRLYRKGFQVSYRPLNSPYLAWPQPSLPQGISNVVFAGTNVLGYPGHLAIAGKLLTAPLALIEGASQAGFLEVAKSHPVLRLFSLNPAYQLQLGPLTSTAKFVLAAHERGQQILYFRPFAKAVQTDQFLKVLTQRLKADHIAVGTPKTRDFAPSPLRYAAWIGVLAGLLLLGLGYRNPYGWLLAFLLFAGVLAYARGESGPLLAALIFPVLGFLERKEGFILWIYATAFALVGVVFLSALGSRPDTVIDLAPFKGVSLTLLVPPVLVMLSFFPRGKSIKQTLEKLWSHPIYLGQAAVFIGLALALLIVYLARGNATGLVAGSLELKLRALLSADMIRPRFKAIIGHASAVVALLLPWPRWVRNSMLALVAVGEASIMNTFSHYHTPLVISLVRVLNGIAVGLIIGLIAYLIIRSVRRWWLA